MLKPEVLILYHFAKTTGPTSRRLHIHTSTTSSPPTPSKLHKQHQRHAATLFGRPQAVWLPLHPHSTSHALHINPSTTRLPHLAPRIPPPSFPPPLHHPSPLRARLPHHRVPPLARNHSCHPHLRPHSRFPLLRLAPAVDRRGRFGESRRGEVREVFEAEGLD